MKLTPEEVAMRTRRLLRVFSVVGVTALAAALVGCSSSSSSETTTASTTASTTTSGRYNDGGRSTEGPATA